MTFWLERHEYLVKDMAASDQSIQEIVENLKSKLKTPADVIGLFLHLGTKEALMSTVLINNLPENGKLYVFPFDILGLDPSKIGCWDDEKVWVNLKMYLHSNPTISEIVEDVEDHKEWYDTMMKNRGRTYGERMNPNKPPHQPLEVMHWQKYAVYDESMYRYEFCEDDPGECPWTHTGDHKDTSYEAFAKVPVYIYFRRCDPSTLDANPDMRYRLLFEGGEGTYRISKRKNGNALVNVDDASDVIPIKDLIEEDTQFLLINKFKV